MRTVHEYEGWLDTLDLKLIIRDGAVVSMFGTGMVIPLTACGSEAEVIHWAVKLAYSFDATNLHLPIKYLTERFVRLVVKSSFSRLNEEELAQKANAAVENRHEIWLPPGT